jgi:hypothetical protein
MLDLPGEGAGPAMEVWSGHGQRIYCPIDRDASLFFVNETLSPPYERLRQKLSKIGWIALGSLVERSKPGQGGPRYQWSRRLGAKTVTVALSLDQFQWLQRAIDNQRQVWHILQQLQKLTARHVLEKLPNPPRRKPISKKHLGLN